MSPNKRIKTSHDDDEPSSQSSNADAPPSAGTNLAGIYELMELILVHLPYSSLLHCTQVSHTWRALITHSSKLQRLLHKTPTPITPSTPNPHFEPATIEASTAVIPRGLHLGAPALATSQDHFNAFLARVTAHPVCIACGNAALDRYDTAKWRVRCAFQGVRVANGWPRGLQQIYCEPCEGFHTHLRLENLHPVMGFLADMDVCAKGEGGKVMVAVYTMHAYNVPRSCWDDYMAQELFFGRSLRRAVDVVQQAGLQGDLLMKPMVTDYILPLCPGGREERMFIHVRNADGVRLGQVLPAYLFATKMCLAEMQRDMKVRLPTMDTWGTWTGAGAVLDMSIRFPTREDYAAYVDGWPDTVRRFDEVASEVNELMSGVEAWEWTEWPQEYAFLMNDTAVA
ncbi:hypothetical protein P171DRAFT_508732 [Karstenula rhodostoma CBS 690.94]|uniref:F-box domain-containing protein n=1 Tax=Karstenula rhodostoma CBS 690.94 TaxID=1392251 RepID=A0A9P4UFY0_9PLEO|nr:hypothetical protein P171DRAFT_508732 [Karstenula rhodostoma CBS 690.94]